MQWLALPPSIFKTCRWCLPKKQEASNLSNDVYASNVFSFTKNKNYTIRVDCKYLQAGDHVLILDDFLANGNAALGLIDLVEQAGGKVAGIGIVIEKRLSKRSQAIGRERLPGGVFGHCTANSGWKSNSGLTGCRQRIFVI